MVTHSMSQAAQLGDRLVMMHRGAVLHDFRGAEKQRLRANDLLSRFEDVRARRAARRVGGRHAAPALCLASRAVFVNQRTEIERLVELAERFGDEHTAVRRRS